MQTGQSGMSELPLSLPLKSTHSNCDVTNEFDSYNCHNNMP